MERYKRYKAFDDWIDEIPEHWEKANLKWISRIYSGGTPDRNKPEYWINGTIPWLNSGVVNQFVITELSEFITEEGFRNSSAKWIPKNAILIALAGQGKTKGMAALLSFDSTCNQSLGAICPNERINSKFLLYFLTMNYRNIRGLSGDELRDGLNLDMIGNINVPIPFLSEQIAIASYLDHKTTEINRLIDNKEKLIALYEEEKMVVINNSVLRGINPDVMLKSSGIEWFGEIPEHWELKKLKWEHKTISGGTPSTGKAEYYNGTIPWIRTIDLTNEEVNNCEIYISDQALMESSARMVPIDSILIAMYGGAGTIGKSGLLKIEASINQAICAIIPNNKNDPRFIHNFIKFYRPYWMIGAEGTRKDPNISQEDIRNMSIIWPSLSEQIEIVTFIECECEQLDVIIDKFKKQIDLLKEYRTNLIFEVVTGKTKVINEVEP